MPDADGVHQPGAVSEVLERAGRVQSVVLGPGIGRDARTVAFVRELALGVEQPLVLDADGLWAFNGDLSALAARSGPTVLTPHAGELARLCGLTSERVSARRLHHVQETARTIGAVTVLKGDDTLVAAADGRVAVSRGDAPALASAGTGDVLAGIVGACLAKGMDPFWAASAAVHVHAAAGRLAAAELVGDGVIAGDVISQIPRALSGQGA